MVNNEICKYSGPSADSGFVWNKCCYKNILYKVNFLNLLNDIGAFRFPERVFSREATP